MLLLMQILLNIGMFFMMFMYLHLANEQSHINSLDVDVQYSARP